jgi:hypothetical protein
MLMLWLEHLLMMMILQMLQLWRRLKQKLRQWQMLALLKLLLMLQMRLLPRQLLMLVLELWPLLMLRMMK